jgi:PAS domain-containing protein
MKTTKSNKSKKNGKSGNKILELKKEIARLKKIEKNKKELEIAFADSKLLYHSLIDLSPEAIIFHVKGKIIYANKAAANLFGSKDETEIIGKKLRVLYLKDIRKLFSRRKNRKHQKKLRTRFDCRQEKKR